MCILFVYTLLKVVSYYDLSVLSMSVLGFQKKKFGWGGWGELYPSLFWSFVNFTKPLRQTMCTVLKLALLKTNVIVVLQLW